ncbi:hypothetical protein NB706_003418 [Xanthomonas sacchari]|nr:hypothetical protein [Xanthomonas sacchari]
MPFRRGRRDLGGVRRPAPARRRSDPARAGWGAGAGQAHRTGVSCGEGPVFRHGPGRGGDGRCRPARRSPAARRRPPRRRGARRRAAAGLATGSQGLQRAPAVDHLRRHPRVRRHHAGVPGWAHPLLSRDPGVPGAGQGRAGAAPQRRPARRLDAGGAQGSAGRRGPLLRHPAVRRRAGRGSLRGADLAPQRAGRARQGQQGRVRLQLSRLPAAARAAQRRGLLPRPARLRRLLAGAARRHRAGANPGCELARHGPLRLRPRIGGASGRHLSQVRRGGPRLLRQRVRRLPGHLHQFAVRQPGMGAFQSGGGGAGRLFQ